MGKVKGKSSGTTSKTYMEKAKAVFYNPSDHTLFVGWLFDIEFDEAGKGHHQGGAATNDKHMKGQTQAYEAYCKKVSAAHQKKFGIKGTSQYYNTLYKSYG